MLNLRRCDNLILLAISIPLLILFITGTTRSKAKLNSSTDESIIV